MLKDAFYGSVLALQFLTRLPLPIACPWTPATRRWAIRAYPLVGLLLGGVLALAAQLLQGAPTPITALALLSLWVALSGGLHLDGVMDLADALGSNQPLARRWEIMKDPQVGSFGILALFFLLAWKSVLLWALLHHDAPLWWLVVMPGLARWGGAALLVLTPCAQQKGMAWEWQKSLGSRDVVLALVPVILMSVYWPSVLAALMATGLFVAFGRWALLKHFQGINGDMVGATIEGGELWLMGLMWSWWWFAMASPPGM